MTTRTPETHAAIAALMAVGDDPDLPLDTALEATREWAATEDAGELLKLEPGQLYARFLEWFEEQ